MFEAIEDTVHLFMYALQYFRVVTLKDIKPCLVLAR